MRAETDDRHLVPRATDPQYIDILNYLIGKYDIGFVHAQNDIEVQVLSENRERIKARTFFPSKETVRICQDKYASFELWKKAGLRVADTLVLRSENDLKSAFDLFGGKLWIRATTGAGGRGSLPVYDFDTAFNWITFQKGWDGTFTASELLTKDSVTWMSLWHDGELVVAQSRRRLYWELSKISPSGVTGATGAGETMSDPVLDEIAQTAVRAIDTKPTGLFGVDLTYDNDGIPNPTEINIGRFFTTHQFFTDLGVNMPYYFVQLAYGETPTLPEKRINPAKDHMVWIRGMDFEPVLVSASDIDARVEELAELRKHLATS
jgi:biotin carboxylase